LKAVIQRVKAASVSAGGETIGKIGQGFAVLLGVEESDTPEDIPTLAEKIVHLRVFEDGEGKMNLSLSDIAGEILLISQFTLLADCKKGRRPSFVKAARPELANEYYESMRDALKERGVPVQTGKFGADMEVFIQNSGPVTILLDSKELKKR